MADPKLDDAKRTADKVKNKAESFLKSMYQDPQEAEPGSMPYFGPKGDPRVRYRATENNNFFTDVTRNAGNFWGSFRSAISGQPQAPAGGGMGDATVGRHPGVAPAGGKKLGSLFGSAYVPKEQAAPDMTQRMSFADALAQAMGLLGQYGGDDGGYGYSDIPFVNYDPQRNEARGRASEADIRLGAMYDQLTKSIDADEAGINQSYESAISNSNAAGDQGRANAQAAADAASSRNNDVLASLGIQDANAQIIGEGRDLNTQTANQQADMASNQAAVAQNLVQNQAASVQQNKSIANASTLEGNLQRARNSAQLNALLAQIDMEEQGQNTGIASQNQQAAMQAANANRSEKNGRLSSAMSFASQLFGANRDDIDRENAMLAEMSRGPEMSKQQNMMNALSALIADGTLPDDMDFDQLVKAMGALK